MLIGKDGGQKTHEHDLTNAYACALLTDRITVRQKEVPYWAATNTTNDGTIGSYKVDWGSRTGIELGGKSDKASNMPPYIGVCAWRRIE